MKIYQIEDEQAIVKRLVKEVVRTGKTQTKKGILGLILKEELKRLTK